MPALLTHSVEWQRIHKRVRATYGLASEYICTDCDRVAHEWSWEHDTDPLDIANYFPRCKSCHKLYDHTEEWQAKINAVLPRGEEVHQSVLSAPEVIEIRNRYASGGISQQKLADEFMVKVMTINKIVNRKTWRHI